MSLKDSWLAGRDHRQQEAVYRQQAVQQTLSEFNQTRQEMASLLHNNLAVFREGLNQQDDQRRVDFQAFQSELKHYYQLLQSETAALLATSAADRELMAQQLATELQAFHQELQVCVRSLRQATQIDITMLKADTQAFLADCQNHRLQVSAETQQTLLQFMESLHGEVQSYLADLADLRQQRANQIQQDLHHSRITREAEVQQLFANLAEFRTELRQYRQSLSQDVWGQTSTAVTGSPQMLTVPKVSAIPPTTAIATKPVVAKSGLAKNAAPGKTAPPKSVPKTAVRPGPAAKKVGTTKVSVPRSAVPTVQPISQDEVPFEKDIYTFLHENHGARLTQIEAVLKVNRFQAVDALRSLIKKGLVTQRDRVYLTQEQI